MTLHFAAKLKTCAQYWNNTLSALHSTACCTCVFEASLFMSTICALQNQAMPSNLEHPQRHVMPHGRCGLCNCGGPSCWRDLRVLARLRSWRLWHPAQVLICLQPLQHALRVTLPRMWRITSLCRLKILDSLLVAGHRLLRVNLSEQTDIMDLLGADLPVPDGAPGAFAWCASTCRCSLSCFLDAS